MTILVLYVTILATSFRKVRIEEHDDVIVPDENDDVIVPDERSELFWSERVIRCVNSCYQFSSGQDRGV